VQALATTLDSQEVQQLRDQFDAMDINKDGTITLDEIRYVSPTVQYSTVQYSTGQYSTVLSAMLNVCLVRAVRRQAWRYCVLCVLMLLFDVCRCGWGPPQALNKDVPNGVKESRVLSILKAVRFPPFLSVKFELPLLSSLPSGSGFFLFFFFSVWVCPLGATAWLLDTDCYSIMNFDEFFCFFWLLLATAPGQMDTNCDGIIDFEEFVAATLHVQQLEEADSEKWEERSRKAFARFDRDNDGYIDAEELRLVSVQAASCQGILRALGVLWGIMVCRTGLLGALNYSDNDGYIDAEELRLVRSTHCQGGHHSVMGATWCASTGLLVTGLFLLLLDFFFFLDPDLEPFLFSAFLGSQAAQSEVPHSNLMAEGDTDGDGRISFAEFKKMLRTTSMNSRSNPAFSGELSLTSGRSGRGEGHRPGPSTSIKAVWHSSTWGGVMRQRPGPSTMAVPSYCLGTARHTRRCSAPPA